MQNFWICVPTKVIFGTNCYDSIVPEVKKYGNRVFLVTGGGSVKKSGLFDKVTKIFDEGGIVWEEYSGVSANPKVSHLRVGIEKARAFKPDIIFALGGGSVIDESKGIAVGYYYDGDVWDLSTELNSKGAAVSTPVVPVFTMLTLAATGTEMATGCNWTNDTVTPHIKRGFHGPDVRPKVTFEDPTNTFTVSAFQTAAGTADVFSHVLESYFTNTPSAFMQARVAEALLKTLIKYGPIAVKDPTNYEARANLMYCSSWGNNGYVVKGNQQNWSVHALEHELTAYNDTTHGDGLAILTPRWMRWVIKDESKKWRFVEYGVNVFGIDPSLPEDEIVNKSIEATEDYFYNQLGLHKYLDEVGIKKENVEDFCAAVEKKLVNNGYLSKCYRPYTPEAFREIYYASFKD